MATRDTVPRIGAMIGLALLALTAGPVFAESPPAAPSAADVQAVYFPETGYTVAGPFWDFWRRRGALDVFGYPLTEAYDAEGIIVQWFQRARFEGWPGQQGVVLPLLGHEAGIVEPPLPAPKTPEDERALHAAGVRYFSETGHLVGGALLSFFDGRGGVEVFGYPLSEEVGLAPEDGSEVAQWFQRARLEWRPGLGVQVGLLGEELFQEQGLDETAVAAPRPDGAPDWYPALVAFAAEQERLAQAVQEAEETRLALAGVRLPASYTPVPGEKWIAIDLSRQRVTAYEGVTPVFSDLVSTGKAGKGVTPPGVFRILRRVANETMDSTTIGYPRGHPLYYRLEKVLYTQYYTNAGHAIHYAWWHNNFGRPMSFGCVNMRLSTAKWFWDWAGIGTPVVVHY